MLCYCCVKILTLLRSAVLNFLCDYSILISLQIKAVNEYDFKGSWSEAFITDTPTQNTTAIIVITPSPITPSSSEIPSWVYIVIALVIVAVLIPVLVVVAVFVLRRYCFHWYSIKTVSYLSLLATKLLL